MIYNSAGDIVLNLGPLATQTLTFETQPYQPDNATHQALLQAALAAEGFDPVATLLNDAVNGLGGALSTPYGITTEMGIQKILPSGYTLASSVASSLASAADSTTTSVVEPTAYPLRRAVRRRDIGRRGVLDDIKDIGEDANDIITNPLVDALCETYDDVSDLEDNVTASEALWALTLPGATPPPATEADITLTATLSVTSPPNSVMTAEESGNSVVCVNCRLSGSSLN